MGLFFNRKNTEVRSVDVSNEDTLIRALLNPTHVTKEMALQIPSISGTIDLIGSIIASTPIKLYEETNGKTEEIKGDNRVFLLNDDTGDMLNANYFWKAIVKDYYTGKGGYAYINRQKGKVKSLHYVDEKYISVLSNNDPIFKDFDICVNGNRYMPFEFIKVLRNTKNGVIGVPITEENSSLISVSYASLMLELNASKRGGNKKGFLKSEKKIDDTAIKKLKEAFVKLYSDNSDSTDNFVVLNSGIDFKESSNTMAEMQLNENKLTNAQEVAKLFHVSPDVVSGKNISTSTLAKLAAIPLMATIQASLNKDLLLEKEKSTRYFAFDTKELLKGEMTERFNAYKTALDANFMQIDEVRYQENLEPLGIDFIKLGLQDVFYNPKTKEVFTPNTGKIQNMSEKSLLFDKDNDIIQERANPNHDPKTGKFTSGKSGKKHKKNRYSSTNKSKSARLSINSYEYNVVTSALATNFPNITSGKKVFSYGDYNYNVKVNDFGDYTIISRTKIISKRKK